MSDEYSPRDLQFEKIKGFYQKIKDRKISQQILIGNMQMRAGKIGEIY